MKADQPETKAKAKALSPRATFSAGVSEGLRVAGIALIVLSFVVSLTVRD